MPISQFDHANIPLDKRLLDFPIVVCGEETDHPVVSYTFDYYEFSILMENSIEFNVGLRTHTITGGGGVFIGPGIQRQWEKPRTPVKMISVFFAPSFLTNFGLIIHLLDKFAYLRSDAVHVFQIKPQLVDEIKWELQHLQSDIGRRNAGLCAARLLLILELLNTSYHLDGKTEVNRAFSYHTQSFLELVKAQYRSRHSVQFYADQLCISPKYMHKLVFAELGHPPKYWINKLLILEAISRLIHTNQPLKIIAQELGYTDVFQFSKAFKLKTGYSPSLFRKKKF